jgi:hypothetical protein
MFFAKKAGDKIPVIAESLRRRMANRAEICDRQVNPITVPPNRDYPDFKQVSFSMLSETHKEEHNDGTVLK